MQAAAELESALRDANVLVVEDDFLIAEDLVQSLRELGAQVLGPAASSIKALQIIEHKRPDCVILDAILQGTAAIDVVQALRGTDIPWILVTGYAVEKLPSEFRGAPCVRKPYDRKTVGEAVATAIQAAHRVGDVS